MAKMRLKRSKLILKKNKLTLNRETVRHYIPRTPE